MARIDPALIPVVTDLDRGLRELGIPFGIVGALVPELLLDARPKRMTNDADVTVVVETLAQFETVKDGLAGFGFDDLCTFIIFEQHPSILSGYEIDDTIVSASVSEQTSAEAAEAAASFTFTTWRRVRR